MSVSGFVNKNLFWQCMMGHLTYHVRLINEERQRHLFYMCFVKVIGSSETAPATVYTADTESSREMSENKENDKADVDTNENLI